MATLATINIKAVLDAKGIEKGVSQGKASLLGFANWAKGAFAAAMTTAAAGAFVGWAARLAMEAETAQTAFGVMIGSADRAKKMLAEMKAFANSTPLTFGGLQESGKLLLQFGVAAENVMPILRMLGDISLGNEQRMYALSLAFAQMSAAGRLMGQDLWQMINAGFNPLQQIAKRTGETMMELKKRMEAGGISTAEVTQAFVDATSEGGTFHKMLATLGPQFEGQFNQFKGALEQFARSVGTAIAPMLGMFLDIGKTFIETITPAAQAFLETVMAMLTPTQGMPDIWKQVSFWIEAAGWAATNMFSVMIGSWSVLIGISNSYWTMLQIGMVGFQKLWAQFWGESTSEIDKELKRLTDFLTYYGAVTKRGMQEVQRGFSGEAGDAFSKRLNKLRDAARNASGDIGSELNMAATAAADTIKVAFKDLNPAALERGSSGAASAILRAQREAEGNRTEKAMLEQLKAIARNTGGAGPLPANI